MRKIRTLLLVLVVTSITGCKTEKATQDNFYMSEVSGVSLSAIEDNGEFQYVCSIHDAAIDGGKESATIKMLVLGLKGAYEIAVNILPDCDEEVKDDISVYISSDGEVSVNYSFSINGSSFCGDLTVE